MKFMLLYRNVILKIFYDALQEVKNNSLVLTHEILNVYSLKGRIEEADSPLHSNNSCHKYIFSVYDRLKHSCIFDLCICYVNACFCLNICLLRSYMKSPKRPEEGIRFFDLDLQRVASCSEGISCVSIL